MGDFGLAEDFFVKSLWKNPLIHYPSRRNPGFFIEFVQYSKVGDSVYYKCNGCFKLSKANRNSPFIPRITVNNGRIITDPDFPKNAHFCDLIEEASSIGDHLFHYIT